jgi:arylsulfatase A-like enzyme
MTGKHPGHAFIRNNKEIKPEGQFPIPTNTVTLAKLLQQQGYRTGAFGKWGLGGPGSTGDPLQQGWDRFFGYNCQRHAHNYYPTSLWDNARRVTLRNPDFSPYQALPADADANKPDSYSAFTGNDYAPDLIAEQARRFIRENKERPFFLFLPTTVPHLALQVPEDSLADYLGQWPDPPYRGGNGYLPHRSPRAAYAAMVTRMDREVGRIMELVSDLALDDRTIFVFTSDNGPTYDRLGGTDSEFFQSAGQFRGLKGSLYEGGIRVPMIVRWKGHIRAGLTSDRMSGFEDWLPTLMELIGPSSMIPKDLDGISFAPTLLGQEQAPRPFLYREFPGYGGQQSLRLGNWKAIRQKLLSKSPVRTELYDLAADPGEANDISARFPDIVSKIERLMRQQHAPSKEFPLPALDADTAD